MGELTFVDTNVFVYARDAAHPEKQQRASSLIADLWRAGTGRLSYQVLNEFYVTVTRKLRPGMDVSAAREDVRSLTAWQPVPVDATVIEGAWFIEDRFGLSVWDSLIVSAARLANCSTLVTEDLQAGMVIEGLTVVNPFG